MKKTVISLIFIFSISLNAQNLLGRKQVEFFVFTENITSENDYFFIEMKSTQSFVWENNSSRFNFNQSTELNLLNSTYPVGAPYDNGGNPIGINYNSQFANVFLWNGWDFVSGSSEPGAPDFAYGLYKITPKVYHLIEGIIETLPGEFYLDMRDSEYPHIPNNESGIYGSNDFYFNYNFDKNKFAHSGFNQPSSFSDFSNYVSEGDVLRIWEIRGLANYTPSNKYFPSNFWSHCLILIDKSDHPFLVWSSYPHSVNSVSSYKIYKSKNSSGFTLLATVSSNTLEYTDYSELLFNGVGFPNKIKYYVKAVLDNNQNSEASNIVSVFASPTINKESTPPPPRSIS